MLRRLDDLTGDRYFPAELAEEAIRVQHWSVVVLVLFCYPYIHSPMISLNHIAIAVDDLTLVKKLFAVIGFETAHTELVADQGVNTHFIPLSTPSHAKQMPTAAVELLEPVDPAGTVAKYLSKRGPGIHHLSFEVGAGELDSICARVTAAGFKMIYPVAKPGAHQMRVNFVHPATTGGILIELMEPAGKI